MGAHTKPRAIEDFRDNLDLLRAWVDYDPETGILVRKKTLGKRGRAGEILGYRKTEGYVACPLLKKTYYAHHLAWAIYYGEIPELEIDHINGVKWDNRIANLRQVTATQNAYNAATRSDNASGARGVFKLKNQEKWISYITYQGKRMNLGTFNSFEDAVSVRKQAEAFYHGEFSPAAQGVATPTCWVPESTIIEVSSANTSGHIGISPCQNGQWSARIKVGEKNVWLGRHDDIQDAIEARQKAEAEAGDRYNHPYKKRILSIN